MRCGVMLRLLVCMMTLNMVQPTTAQLPGVAIPVGNGDVYINENDSDEVCVVKRSGTVSANGLTVPLMFIDITNIQPADMGVDYSVSGNSVSFTSGAADGELSCINITAISDDVIEGEETVLIFLPGRATYDLDLDGMGYSNTIRIHFLDNINGPPSPPENLRIQDDTLQNSPTVTIEWDAREAFTYRIMIQQVLNYSMKENGTSHTITADGRDVLFNTQYDVQVTAVNSVQLESSPATLQITISAAGPPMPLLSSTQDCFQVKLTWTYGLPDGMVYSPPLESVNVTYTVEMSEDGAQTACPNLTTNDTSCNLMIPQGNNYTFMLNLTNIINTTSASTAIDATLSKDPPSPPQNLRNMSSESSSSAIIKWDHSTTDDVVLYRITILHTSYLEEKSCTEQECTHTITADGSIVKFNTLYIVEVTAVSPCGRESEAAITTIYTENEQPSNSGRADDTPVWVWILIGVTVVLLFVTITTVVVILLCCYKMKDKHRDEQEMMAIGRFHSSRSQQSSGVEPQTRQLYSEIQFPKTSITEGDKIYQDPNTIEHEEAGSGDLYALTQKQKKNGQEQIAVSENTLMRNEHPFALQYAELNFTNQDKATKPPKTVDTSYVEVQYDK